MHDQLHQAPASLQLSARARADLNAPCMPPSRETAPNWSPPKAPHGPPVASMAVSLGVLLQQHFTTTRVGDSDMLAEIRRVWNEHEYLVDPHTAVALVAAHRLRWVGEEVVILATAHACKFEEALQSALGQPVLQRLRKSHESAIRPPQVLVPPFHCFSLSPPHTLVLRFGADV